MRKLVENKRTQADLSSLVFIAVMLLFILGVIVLVAALLMR
jgi:hypothetical protein